MSYSYIIKLLATGVLLNITVSLSAQHKIRYSYDAAGNRTKKELVIEPQKAPDNRQNVPPNHNNTGFTGRCNAEIYIEDDGCRIVTSIKGLTKGDRCHIEMYSAQGAMVMRRNAENGITMLDLANMQSGVYLLRVTINDEAKTWKITKR